MQLENIEQTIQAFAESEYKAETGRFPGYAYGLGTRYNNLSDLQLLIEYESLKMMNPENTTMDEADINYATNKVREELLARYNNNNTIHWNYVYAPYFTESEVDNFLEGYWRSGVIFDDPYPLSNMGEWRKRVEALEDELRGTVDPDQIKRIHAELIALGWNPEVDCNDENIAKARDRITAKYNDDLKNTLIIDSRKDVDIMGANDYSSSKSSIGESMVPINLILYGDGTNRAIIGKIDLHEDENTANIYTVFAKNPIKVNEIYTIKNLFIKPSNYRAYEVIKRICKENAIDQTLKRIIIRKIYSGKLSEANYDNINRFLYNMGDTNKVYPKMRSSIHEDYSYMADANDYVLANTING